MATVVSTLPITPLALQAVVGDTAVQYNAVDLRYLIGSLYPRSGRVGDYLSMWVFPNQAGANWSVDVNAGMAVVAGASTGVPEKYLATLGTRTNVPLTGFNTSPSATRTHAAWIVIDDKNTSPGAGYAARIVLTEDTGSGAPNPNYPFYFKLATFTIAPAQSNVNTANITNVAPRGDRKATVYPLTLDSGFTTLSGGQAPSFSVVGNTVTLQGHVSITSPLAPSAGVITFITQFASGIRPAYNRYFTVVVTNGANFGRLVVNAAGSMTITPAPFNTANMSSFSLDGISYELA